MQTTVTRRDKCVDIYFWNIIVCVKVFYQLVKWGRVTACDPIEKLGRGEILIKTDIERSIQDSNLGFLNSSQMLLSTEPVKLWH